MWTLSPQLRPASEARCVSGSLYGGPERPFPEAVKLRPGLPSRDPRTLELPRVMGYLPRRAANRECNQPKREKWVSVKTGKRSWRSEEQSGIRHEEQSLEFSLMIFSLV